MNVDAEESGSGGIVPAATEEEMGEKGDIGRSEGQSEESEGEMKVDEEREDDRWSFCAGCGAREVESSGLFERLKDDTNDERACAS